MNVQRDIAYAEPEASDGRFTSLDVFSPVSGTGVPVMVWIHGGYWRHGDKTLALSKPQAFVDKGFIFVSLNYRLVPEVTYKVQAGDIAQAMRWVHEHAKDYGGSPDRLFLLGHSSGAHLAALVATDERYLKVHGLALDTIKGVILLDGIGYDLPSRLAATPPSAVQEFEEAFGSDEEAHKDASPIKHVAKGKSIPTFLIIYIADQVKSRARSQHFALALQDAGVPVEVMSADEKTHATLSYELGQPGDKPTKAIFDFLGRLNNRQTEPVK